jgi:hypothetical protein
MPKKNVQKMKNKFLRMIKKEKNDFDDPIWKKSKNFDNNKRDATQKKNYVEEECSKNELKNLYDCKEINAITMHLA